MGGFCAPPPIAEPQQGEVTPKIFLVPDVATWCSNVEQVQAMHKVRQREKPCPVVQQFIEKIAAYFVSPSCSS